MSGLLEMMHVSSLQFFVHPVNTDESRLAAVSCFFLPKTGEVAQYSEDNCPKDVKV